jgi:polar amino acid transport system ATP-binding protein
MSNRLDIRGVYISYGSTQVLRGVDLTIERGATTAVLGRSGCGKTTLLRGICGLIPLASGSIVLDDQTIINDTGPLFEQWEIRRKVMYVAQTPTLLPYLTALQNVTLALRIVRGLSPSAAVETAQSVASKLQLDSQRLDSYPEQLSGGEAQRVQLLRAMVLQPDVLQLDEVTANIDPEITKDIIDTLWLLRDLSGKSQTIAIVTHIVTFAAQFADNIVFLHNGVVHEQGAARTFLEEAKHEETLRFLSRNTLL